MLGLKFLLGLLLFLEQCLSVCLFHKEPKLKLCITINPFQWIIKVQN